MLAWRAVFRPATIARRGLQKPIRSLHVSTPRLQVQQPRGVGSLAKVRFRPDGKPRSRLVGAAFGALILFNVLTLLTTYDIVEDSEVALGLLASMIYIQQADMEYNTVNLDDSLATLSYFKKLYQSFSRIPADEVDDLFKDLTRLMKLGGEKNPEAEAHRIMRTASEQIHNAFQELNQESISSTANFILLVMRDALDGLIDLVQDADDDDDDSDSKYTFQLIRDHSRKDPGAVLKDYESLG
ncbi:hypothetical protein GALMADRAFT_219046 [Galerina marginata CBS 339.88]|uniref:Uncharacterized protein n=1 Tax=Galerina marginata (strain CBS 339.88) TaxID=685588 RepID=A0A067TS19_GALM3|nr:hypothetical protein GALMADRAFT_219046 [Galerina marginata CBS 339.88]